LKKKAENINIRIIKSNKLEQNDLIEIKEIYKQANWITDYSELPDHILKQIIDNSFCFAVAETSTPKKIIAIGRSISDGVSDAYLQDVSVLIEYRNLGIGKKIIKTLIQYLQENNITWIALIAEPNYSTFYEPLGFKKMINYTPMKFKIYES